MLILCSILVACDQLPRCSVAGSRIDQGLDGRFRSALGSLAINVRDIASIRLTDISETSSSKFTRSCAATLNVELKPGLWQKMTVFMGNPTSFDDRLQSDLMAIELTNQLHPEKINGGNISLNYTFDVRPDSKEPEVKTPLQEKSSAIYGDTLPMTIVEPYLRMSARALASVSTLPVQPVAAPTSLPAPAPLATPDTVASTPPTVDQGVSAARQEQVPQEATAAPTSHEAVQSTAPPVPPPLVKEQARGSSLALRHPNHPPATQKQRKLNPGALKVIAASARIHWATGQSDP